MPMIRMMLITREIDSPTIHPIDEDASCLSISMSATTLLKRYQDKIVVYVNTVCFFQEFTIFIKNDR